ncbi:hypothetical protein [Rossellomorea marisflavi]|uniref:hypothetical protein n=1 Tax=Rossellomorea marisflavi TaxID=189381 RepID=UPI003FA01CA0
MFLINLFEDKNYDEIAQLIADYFHLDFDRVENELGIYSGFEYDLFDFLERFDIDLEKSFQDDIKITCRHALATDNNGFAFLKEKGLLNLKVMLEVKTTLSSFLLEQGIKVNVEEKILEFDGKKYPILDNNTRCERCIYDKYECKDFISDEPILRDCDYRKELGKLHIKLYSDKCQIEGFIDGSFEDIYAYDSVRESPEILKTINNVTEFYGQNENILKDKWSKRKNTNFYIIEFEVPLENLENVSVRRIHENDSNVLEIVEKYGYEYENIVEDDFSKEIKLNLFVIKTLMDLAYKERSKIFAQLKTSTVIKGESIRVIREHNVNTSSSEEKNRGR